MLELCCGNEAICYDRCITDAFYVLSLTLDTDFTGLQKNTCHSRLLFFRETEALCNLLYKPQKNFEIQGKTHCAIICIIIVKMSNQAYSLN